MHRRLAAVLATLLLAVAAQAQDFTFLRQWGVKGTGQGEFHTPVGVLIHPNGYLYITDIYRHMVQIWTKDGQYVSSFGSLGSGDGQFQHPHSVAVDSNGILFISDQENHRIQKFSPSGTFLGKWGSYGSGDGQFNSTAAGMCVTVSTSGHVFVADPRNQRIQKFTRDGVFLTKWSYGFNFFGGITTSASGNVFVSDFYNQRILEFTPDGAYVQTWGSGLIAEPSGISFAANGDLIAGDPNNTRIVAFSSPTVIRTTFGAGGVSSLNGIYGVHVDTSGYVVVADPYTANSKQIKVFQYGENLDSTPPTSSISVSPAPGSSGWITSTPTITVSALDSWRGSGVKEIRHTVDMGAEQTTSGPSASIPLSSDGIHSIGYRSLDHAGNSEIVQNTTIKLDREAPTTSGAIVAGLFSMDASDAVSGVALRQYRVNSGAWTAYSAPVVLPSSVGTVGFRATDVAGNVASEKTVVVNAMLKSLTITPTAAFAGSPATVKVELAAPAPSGGTAVTLTSSSPSILVLPSTVTVPAGSTFATLTPTLGPVTGDTVVNVNASVGATKLDASVAVSIPFPKTLTGSPSVVPAGGTTKLTVTLISKAPAGGTVVSLTSLDPTLLTVPTTVTVPQGALKATVTATSLPTSSDRAALVTAEVDGSIAVCAIVVRRITVSKLVLTPTSVVGGATSSLTVTLSRPAPAGGVLVPLAATGDGATVPASVTIGAGSTTGTVNITTVPTETQRLVQIRASLNGAVVRSTLTIVPAKLSSIVFSPSSLKGGTTATLTVNLSGVAPAGGVLVKLATTHPDRISLPETITIPAGSASIQIRPVTTSGIATTAVQVLASQNTETRSATLTLTP